MTGPLIKNQSRSCPSSRRCSGSGFSTEIPGQLRTIASYQGPISQSGVLWLRHMTQIQLQLGLSSSRFRRIHRQIVRPVPKPGFWILVERKKERKTEREKRKKDAAVTVEPERHQNRGRSTRAPRRNRNSRSPISKILRISAFTPNFPRCPSLLRIKFSVFSL